MSRRLNIPVGASLNEQWTCVLPIGPMAGKTWFGKLFSGNASKGYKSGYTPTPHKWIEFIVPDANFRQAFGFSGSRLAEADKCMSGAIATLQEHGGSPSRQI